MDTNILPFATMTVGGVTYRLKITAQAAIEFEKKVGTSIPRAWVRLDEIQIQAEIIHAALKAYNSGIGFDEALDVIDRFIAEGNCIEDLMDIIKEIYIVSGFMKRAPTPASSEADPEENSEETTDKSLA